MRLKPLISFSKIIAINLLVLIVLIELCSITAYYVKTRQFFYSRDRGRVQATKAHWESQYQLTNSNPTPAFRLHPYFGYTHRKGSADEPLLSTTLQPANNFGFLSSFDFPYKKSSDNQYLIGIFGGSVAEAFALHEMQTHALNNALKQSPHFAGKELVFLCFAIGAYKQPQQLLILNYFLSIGQQLDMVINIDGFKEIAVSELNRAAGVDISMPAVQVSLPLIELANKDLSASALSLSLKVLELKKDLKVSVNGLAECRFATCYTLRWIYLQYLARRLQKTLEQLAQLDRVENKGDSLITLKTIDKQLMQSEGYDKMSDLWSSGSSMMKDQLSATGIEYFHFIQPNQYFPTRRVFSEEERKIAFLENSPYKAAIEAGYPKLILKMPELQKRGENVFNAVNIFDDVKDIVYSDDCCHYSKIGNDVFAKFVAEKIISTISSRPLSKS